MGWRLLHGGTGEIEKKTGLAELAGFAELAVFAAMVRFMLLMASPNRDQGSEIRGQKSPLWRLLLIVR
jgi:hypothetical protein